MTLDTRDATKPPPAELDVNRNRLLLRLSKMPLQDWDRAGPCPCASGSCRHEVPAGGRALRAEAI